MPVNNRVSRPSSCRGVRLAARLQVEQLETRTLPAVTGLGLDDTINLAHELGPVAAGAPVNVAAASIGDETSGAADVDWYRFEVSTASQVNLRASGAVVLSLYNDAPFDFLDVFNPTGHRLLAQADAGAGGSGAALNQVVAPGTYYIAVSGAGNRDFSPFLADSGLDGSTGDYALQLKTTDVSPSALDGPTVVAADPASATLTHSPLVIRLTTSSALDSTQPDQTVTLTYNPTGAFGDGNDVAIALSFNTQFGNTQFSTAANELQVVPQASLAPGYYRLVLAGDSSLHPSVLRDLNTGAPLGMTAAAPFGQDYSLTFQVTGIEGNVGAGAAADDTPGTSHDLGNLTGDAPVRVVGTIGDDPAYDPASSDPFLANPADDVDLYHFTITGPG